MEIFEGKEGLRIFKRKEDAEFAAEKNSQMEKRELIVQKVRISDEDIAQRKNISVHSDVGIAARPPKEGETGWIVKKPGKNLRGKYREALALLEG